MPRIALVDDEQSILTSVSIALEQDGFEVDTFINGEEALCGLEKNHYDLGLFDIKMPRMTGNELLMKLRSSKDIKLQNMPIIFLTSKDQEQDEIIGLRMGAADYIKKPFSQKLLNERIRTVLRIHMNRKKDNSNEIFINNNIKAGYVGNLFYKYLDVKVFKSIIRQNEEVFFYFIGPYEKSNLLGDECNLGFINFF